MQKLKKIKKMLKQEKLWSIYKHKFSHKQMQLLFSKISLIFVPNVEIDWLFENEKKILSQTKNHTMFIEVFQQLSILNKDKYDWKAFGAFVWFVYQTSSFYQDQKHGIKNIFNEHNLIQQNAQKRHFYYLWLQSIDPSLENYNTLIKQVLACVF